MPTSHTGGPPTRNRFLLHCIVIDIFLILGNIGMSMSLDHRWITQFSALFCVLVEMDKWLHGSLPKI